MTSKEAAEKCGVAWITIRKWCKANNIKKVKGLRAVMAYDLSEADVKKFKARNKKRGYPKFKKY